MSTHAVAPEIATSAPTERSIPPVAMTMVMQDGTPLCRIAAFVDRPHAYPKLWKHHAAQPQAERVTAVAAARREPWLSRYGGRISSEWQFAKALQVLEEDREIYETADRWIEAADWIVWQLCGSETRNVCTAGYKGLHQDGAYPSSSYLRELHPDFVDFVPRLLDAPLSPLGGRAGDLTRASARTLGLPEGIAVAVGNVDAHVTAPAARAIDPGHMSNRRHRSLSCGRVVCGRERRVAERMAALSEQRRTHAVLLPLMD